MSDLSEREAVVRWLRGKAVMWSKYCWDEPPALETELADIADAIERGDHMDKEEG